MSLLYKKTIDNIPGGLEATSKVSVKMPRYIKNTW